MGGIYSTEGVKVAKLRTITDDLFDNDVVSLRFVDDFNTYNLNIRYSSECALKIGKKYKIRYEAPTGFLLSNACGLAIDNQDEYRNILELSEL